MSYILCFRKNLQERKQFFRKGQQILEKDTDLLKIVNRIRTLQHVKNVILQKHQRKLLKFFYNNVLNKEEKEEQKRDWQTLLANLGQIKKAFKQAVDKESKLDKKLIKQLLNAKDFIDFNDQKF